MIEENNTITRKEFLVKLMIIGLILTGLPTILSSLDSAINSGSKAKSYGKNSYGL